MGEIALFGDINIDVLMAIPRYPGPGEDAMATHITLQPGGSVANTAIVLAKLGTQTRMISRVGDDRWAEIALQPLIDSGVDVTHVTRDPIESTGLIFIPVVIDGERTMFSYRGANLQKPVAEIERGIFTDVSMLHISAYNFLVSPQREATWRAVELAAETGVGLTMDVGVEPAVHAKSDLENVLPGLSILVIGFEEAQLLIKAQTPQDAVKEFLDKGVEMVGLKLGRDGCIIATQGERFILPGFDVDTVDTTGAGDAFCSGLIYAMLKDVSLSAGGMLANTLGALATTVWGGGPMLPGREEVLEFLSKRMEEFKEGEKKMWAREVIEVLSSAAV